MASRPRASPCSPLLSRGGARPSPVALPSFCHLRASPGPCPLPAAGLPCSPSCLSGPGEESQLTVCTACLWLPAHLKGCFQRSPGTPASGRRRSPSVPPPGCPRRSLHWLTCFSLAGALAPHPPRVPSGDKSLPFSSSTSSFPHGLAPSGASSFLLCPGHLWPLTSRLGAPVPLLAPAARFATLKFHFI